MMSRLNVALCNVKRIVGSWDRGIVGSWDRGIVGKEKIQQLDTQHNKELPD